MDFLMFILGMVAVGLALTYIKRSSPNAPQQHD